MVSESGVVFPYEKAAIAGDDMPDGLSSPDAWMFQCLRLLYAQKRIGIITRSRAVAEKRKLLDRYRVMEFEYGLMQSDISLRKNLEQTISEYRKCPTIENADRMLFAYDGAKRKEARND